MAVPKLTPYEEYRTPKLIFTKVLNYFKDENNDFEDFEKWHKEKYGVPFDWSKCYEKAN